MQNDICPRCNLSINNPMSPGRSASSVGTHYTEPNTNLEMVNDFLIKVRKQYFTT